MIIEDIIDPKLNCYGEEIKRISDWTLDIENALGLLESKGEILFSGIFDSQGSEIESIWPQECNIIYESWFCKRIFSFLASLSNLKNETVSGNVLSRVDERLEYTNLSKGIFLVGWIAYWVLFIWLIAFWKV